MAKLTKAQTRQLAGILERLTRVEAYLNQEKIAGIAYVETGSPDGSCYTIVNPDYPAAKTVRVMNKHIGSEIALLYTAKKELSNFLEGQ